MRGRKKIPNELKKLTNSRWHDKNVPNADGKPICPAHLSERAKTEWRYLVPLLDAKGVLDKTDRFVLEAYCEEVATARAAQEVLNREGVTLAYQNSGGNWAKNPYVLIAKDAREKAMRYASMLGITPTDRGKLSVSDVSEPTMADVLFADV